MFATGSRLQGTASIRNLLLCNGGGMLVRLYGSSLPTCNICDHRSLHHALLPCEVARLINYCSRAAAAAAALETPGALFAQRELEERWARLVENYDSYTVRVRWRSTSDFFPAQFSYVVGNQPGVHLNSLFFTCKWLYRNIMPYISRQKITRKNNQFQHTYKSNYI